MALFKIFKDRSNLSDNAPQMFLDICEFIPDLPKLKTKGEYPKGVPEGIVIHYTAGNQNQSAESALKFAYDQGYTYFFIDAKGIIYQQFDLNRWGNHAGESICPVTGIKNLSKYCVGIEVACSGKLDKREDGYYTWFGKKIPSIETRFFKGSETQRLQGYYQIFKEPQENALFTLCKTLCKIFNIDPSLIYGHDEISIGRKNDPAGSLSMTMPEWRNKIRNAIYPLKDFGLH